MGSHSAHRLVGRQHHEERIRAALVDLEAGDGSLLLVQGEPGIGKTRLLDEAYRMLTGVGCETLVGRAGGIDFAGGAVPYGLVSELLLDLADDAERQQPGWMGGHGWGVLSGALPLAEAPTTGPTSNTDRLAVFAAARRFLQVLLQRCPVALLVDDLHWADSPSLDVLTYLVEALARRPLMAMLTFRPSAAGDVQRTLAQLTRSSQADLLTLAPLTPDEVAEQLRQLMSDEPDDADVSRIAALSGGVPLYVEELAGSGSTARLPARLEVALGNRLSEAPEATRRILSAAALHPQPVDAAALARVTRLPRQEIHAALSEGTSRGLLEAAVDGTYRFHHVLVQQAIGNAMTAADQQAVHRAWARRFEKLAETGAIAQASVIAYHWYHSGDAKQALPALVRAGFEAHRLGGLREAATHWRNALALWQRVRDPSQRANIDRDTLLVLLDEAYEASSQWGADRELLEAEERLGDSDPVKRVWIDLRRRLVHDFLGLPVQPVVGPQNYEEVLSDLSNRVATAPTRMLADCLLLLGDNDPAVPLDFHLRRLGAAEQVAKRSGDRALQAHVLDSTADQLRFHGDLTAAVEVAQEAVHVAEEVLFPSEINWLRGGVIHNLTEIGRAKEAVEEGERALASAARISADEPGRGWFLAFSTAMAHIAAGDLGRARELLEPVCRHPGEPERATALYELARIALCHGNLDRAAELIAQADLLETSQWWVVDARGTVRGWLHQCRGETDEARAELLPVLSTIPRYPKWVMLAVATRRHEDGATSEWVEKLELAAQRLPSQGTVTAATRAQVDAHLASLAGREDCDRWARAVDLWTQADGYQEPEAWCQLRYAEALLPEHRFEEAEHGLRAALDIAAALPCPLLADEIHTLARRARLTLPQRGTRPRADRILTAREEEVLHLVARGKTNHEIASELFMSPKTASVHVSRILQKLGVSNRTEAAWSARRMGLD